MRTTRPDGNCFYRGFAFGLCEWLMTLAEPEDVTRVVSVFEASKADLLAAGFDEFIDDFWAMTMAPLRAIKGGNYSHDDLLACFRDQERTEYIVQFMRFLVSLHLAKNADFFQFFIEGSGLSVDEFRRIEVEAVGRDADHVQITALTAYLDLAVRVVYLDQSTTADGAASEIVIPDGGRPVCTLLYRPGHYDVLYE
ncbi:ubiquitin thioesterase OTUB1 [Thecamonas trahens ATCC 50062]|uniref:ubiquitinyl hydrolase 1 n=1 Tax=Thecamonas trahens ATCC 50062 TaxID=461836 RepID=A0A0L0DFY3_THETB|nr:ubiquitin thioesterase OTUB1 [Thecamonas trahens ATCC 50062]KNC51085.1 ubiquitin thioesterase OTUB1 [Thecamonas trahens ATCC 50062]|eukprot:XP_013756541.1 ubiquitin thioesterase OTUB1 [Thecamonas trahens ATCC 50062]